MDLCRICHCDSQNTLLNHLFENNLPEKLEFTTGVRFDNEHNFPSQICDNCIGNLAIAHDFKSSCLVADANFQKLFSSNDLPIKIKSEDVDNDFYFEDNDLGGINTSALTCEVILNDNPVTNENVKLENLEQQNKTRNSNLSESIIKKNGRVIKKEVKSKRLKRKTAHSKLINCEEYVTVTDLIINKEGVDNNSYRVDFEKRKQKQNINLTRKLKDKDTALLKAEIYITKNNTTKVNKWCGECDIKFKTKKDFESHKAEKHLQNSEEKSDPPFWMCEICGAHLANRSSLGMHRRIHARPRFPCPQPRCNYSTITRGELNRHMRIHSGIKSFKCKHCERTFHTSSARNDHTRRMHEAGEKRHKCHLCQKAFFNPSLLNRHLDSHAGVKRLECSICHERYTRRHNWKRHMLHAHNITIPRVERKGQLPSYMKELEHGQSRDVQLTLLKTNAI